MFECKKLKIFTDKEVIVEIKFKIIHSLALVGESGSGKTLTLKALLGLLPKELKMELDYSWEYPLIRGKTLSLVPQNPFTSLSPLTKIKNQFFTPPQEAQKLLELVGLEASFLEKYPPQLSGGQLQRVVIAMALSQKPKLLLLDEPTTALDPKTKTKVLKLFQTLQKELNFLILFVTHDIASAKKLCKEIAVIRKGRIVETGKMEEVFNHPKEEYTKMLIESNFANRKFRE
ncbi:MAG: ABC transporter ATP-binding protein [Epsilonproteobacteria bacterium]|nr:ABC transporter ATP-binding protein [Campylobacterota bacterium]